MMTPWRIVVGLLLVLLVTTAAPAAEPDDKLEIRDAETVRLLLDRMVGQRIGLIVREGPELTGTLVKVGDNLVHLTGLQGREFFDVVIRLDRIDGVVVRVRKR